MPVGKASTRSSSTAQPSSTSSPSTLRARRPFTSGWPISSSARELELELVDDVGRIAIVSDLRDAIAFHIDQHEVSHAIRVSAKDADRVPSLCDHHLCPEVQLLL